MVLRSFGIAETAFLRGIPAAKTVENL